MGPLTFDTGGTRRIASQLPEDFAKFFSGRRHVAVCPLLAARELDQPIAWPVQYLRAAPKGAQPRIPVV